LGGNTGTVEKQGAVILDVVVTSDGTSLESLSVREYKKQLTGPEGIVSPFLCCPSRVRIFFGVDIGLLCAMFGLLAYKSEQ
jgi:hypothetical protein